jgi:hypothetical protein
VLLTGFAADIAALAHNLSLASSANGSAKPGSPFAVLFGLGAGHSFLPYKRRVSYESR